MTGEGVVGREALLDLLGAAKTPLGLRDMLRALGLSPDRKIALRGMLHDLALEGAFRTSDLQDSIRGVRDLPLVAEVVVTGFDRREQPLARLAEAEGLVARHAFPPIVFLHPEPPGHAPLVPGARVLARLKTLGSDRYEGRTLRVLRADCQERMGVFERLSPDSAREMEGRILSFDTRPPMEWPVVPDDAGRVRPGDVVRIAPIGKENSPVRIVERFGAVDCPAVLRRMTVAECGLAEDFPADALAEAAGFPDIEATTALADGTRRDLRDVPFITVDGPQARDFDDAIWACAEGGGYRVCVAIADVTWYVRPDSALDRVARQRGQSAYFPDHVRPMLPSRLSDGLCSLRPEADRLCVLFEMHMDAQGRPGNSTIRRGVMRSHARLTYEQLQQIRDGGQAPVPAVSAELVDTLYAVHGVLARARLLRGAQPAETEEFRVEIDPESGKISWGVPVRLESHRLIESFMILANETAAGHLLKKGGNGIFRTHPPPARKEKGRSAKKDGGRGDEDEKSPLVTRLPAFYAADPAPHDALAASVYAHVTSPIRRYADLACHRALLGETPLSALERTRLATHLTTVEALVTTAVRRVRDRILIRALRRAPEQVLEGHVTGETPSGVLVTLTETGVTGLLVSDAAVRGSMARYSIRAGTEGAAGPMPSVPSVVPKKGTAVRVRPIVLAGSGSFDCLFERVVS